MSRLAKQIRAGTVNGSNFSYSVGWNDAKEEDAKLVEKYHKQLAEKMRNLTWKPRMNIRYEKQS